MGFLDAIFNLINDLTWGWALVPFLVVIGVFFTVTTGFVQFRFFRRMFRVLRPNDPGADPNAISAREALLISVGGRVGGGNIAGVAVAISLGGPGAVFWMWAIALIGMATSLIESSLAQLYKRRDPDTGEFRGGPARSIIHGLGEEYRWLAVLYAICLIASFAIGFNAFQGNTVAGAAADSFGIDRVITGIVLTVGTGLIVFGGIHRIAKVADKIVPVMAVGYLALAAIIIVLNLFSVPAVLWDIVANAFGLREAVGGGMGAALAQGLRRGLFSNEAGLGSAPNVAATAAVRHPISQGITQSLSVFIDTILICTATALVILLGDVYVPGNEIDGVVLTQQSLASHLGGWTSYVLTIAILLFAFSSIIYNYYLGENALSVLTDRKIAVQVLRLAIMGIVFLGAVAPNAMAVFSFSDPMMGILAVVNLLALMMLFPTAKRILDDFRAQLAAGVERPVFDPDRFADLDIDRTAWTGKAPEPFVPPARPGAAASPAE
ncbi:alanine/glycine:cation symporter family protein [Jannaschia formosa]|uniref:alanine/glycine:cation symporter family protein n=1 Tax=Jannaschia formosa TaxID=2259592 RepID=UPI000E1BD69D|nr:alanine/glycine:cation symporter family protein [Jannaschia formosa]TFL20166.1 alanine:cation symporter family protein [Jannaschia formosa]